jgi:GAF domain-containing protein
VAPTLVTADPFATPSAAAGPALDARGKEVKLTKRLSGDDLLSDLFEAMHDVHFQPGLLEGVHFVLWLAVEKMPCRVAICHLFDINRREFVVAHALGERRADLLLKRVSEREPLLQQVLRRRRAVVMNAGDPLLAGERWGAIGQQVQSAVSAPVVLGGRFLGVLELVNPMDGKPFSEGDGYALAYMGEQFAEFLGQRGLLLDPEAILAFKPPRL